ncbi:MAG: 4Fe-4S binding protein [Bacteroidales bacterium]|nr:4Fe-4S binding protein [Bacteroidales bacterium]
MPTGEIYFRHSLRVNDYLCQGCTTCMRTCPTAAIRIRGGKAVISDNKCVDCGECMKACPHKAIYIKQDDFGLIENYRYRVCLVPTTFIGQFDTKYKTKAIYSCLLKLGFTHIYEVEHEVPRMMELYNRYMEDHPEISTFISPYCPAVTRLIQVRFPSLVDNVIHVRAPLELASRVIVKRLMDDGARRESIGVFYVTPCAAKIAAVKYPVSGKETYVSGVINMDFLYNKVLLMLHDSDKNAQPINHALTARDVMWPLAGGEAVNFKGYQYAVDGLQNVLNFLEKLEDEAVDAPGLVEMRICDQGCVGGVLTTNDRFVARKRLEYRARLFERLENSKLRESSNEDNTLTPEWIKDMEIPDIKPRSIYKLNDNYAEAFKMAERMKKIEKALPGVNCSACGAPSCAALAEDIVRGDANADTCVFINPLSKTSKDAMNRIWGDRIKSNKEEQ